MKKRDRDAMDPTVGPVKTADAARDDVAELLSAYAVGGLAPDEAARVEAYLADHPRARGELDEIARTLAAVRASEPRPHGEPDWDAMAREIQRACSDEPAAPRWQFWRRPWSRRPVVLAAAGAVAVALVFVALSRGDDATPGREETAAVGTRGRATPAEGAAADPARVDPARVDSAAEDDSPADEGGPNEDADADEIAVAADSNPDLRAPVLGDLDSDELDRLENSLDGQAAPEDAFVAELLAAGRIDAFPDPTDRRDPYGEDEDESPAIDPFQAPDYVPIDELADELPDEAIEAIDRFLAEVKAG